MTEGRRKLGYELNQSSAYSLRDVTPHLHSKRFDPEKEYFEFLIRGKIRPDDIRALLTLPYEVSLDEELDVILSTGIKNAVADEEHILRRRNHGKRFFHTHPDSEGEFQGTPSLHDAFYSYQVKGNLTLSLAHSGGIIIYRGPFLDPVTQKIVNPSEDFFDIFKKYASFNRTWLDAEEIPDEVKSLYDKRLINLNQEEGFRFERQFAEQTGMIVDEAKWEDKEGIERVVAKAFAGLNK